MAVIIIYVSYVSNIVSDYAPTLPQLLKLDVPLRVRDNYDSFGIFLLNDKNGDNMAIIRKKCHQDPEEITRTVLNDWLQGKGTNVSWESIIKALHCCKMSFFAEQIQMAYDNFKSSKM